jgi:hypothetical protein
MHIAFTQEQYARIEEYTREYGYASPAEYLWALVEADNEEVDDFDEDIDVEAEFREAWRQAMTGQTMPARESMARIRRALETSDDNP